MVIGVSNYGVNTSNKAAISFSEHRRNVRGVTLVTYFFGNSGTL